MRHTVAKKILSFLVADRIYISICSPIFLIFIFNCKYRHLHPSDRSVREVDIVTKVPSSWEATSEGPAALLRAARDADDAALNEIAVQVRKFGFGGMDVNMADSSGRVSLC